MTETERIAQRFVDAIVRMNRVGYFGLGTRTDLMAVVGVHADELNDVIAYRSRVVRNADEIVKRIHPCHDYVRVLSQYVNSIDHEIARKLYELYRVRRSAYYQNTGASETTISMMFAEGDRVLLDGGTK